MYKIEKNVPIPKRSKQKKYPLMDMNVGDSFWVPCESRREALRERNKIFSMASYYQTKHNVKFTTRTYEDGVRIWRIK